MSINGGSDFSTGLCRRHEDRGAAVGGYGVGCGEGGSLSPPEEKLRSAKGAKFHQEIFFEFAALKWRILCIMARYNKLKGTLLHT